MNSKQAQFVREYLIDQNGAQAAIRAGYSAKTGRTIADQLLTKLDIRAAVDAGLAELAERTGITAERVRQELGNVGFSDVRGFFDAKGNLRPLHTLTPEQAAAIASVEVVTKSRPSCGDEPAKVEYTYKIRFWDKVAALTQLGRHLQMFTDRTEHTGGVNFVIEHGP